MLTPAQPVLKYPGAKWRLAPWIVPHLPPHRCYIEPFFGSGAIFFSKQPSRQEVINDRSGEVVNFFTVLRDRGPVLAEAIALTPWAREEYERSYELAAEPLERARRFLVRCWQGFGGRIAGRTGWRRRDLNHAPHTQQWCALPARLMAVADRLKPALIECRPAVDLIREYRHREVLLYVDPPYVLSTRSGPLYHHEMSDAEHLALLDALDQHPGPVVLSGYAHPLYDDRLRGWQRLTQPARAERGKPRTEVLWIKGQVMCQQALL